MADRVLQRRDTSANWSSANPILAEGEMGIVTDTKGYKIGDGSTAWNDLEYPSNPTTISNELGSSSTVAASQSILTESVLNTIQLDDIDLDSGTIAKLMLATVPARYTVMSNNKNCGTLDIIGDNMGHMLTQVFETHYIVTDGELTESHSDDVVYRYTRSYHHTSGGTSTIPVGTWGDWVQIYSSTNNQQIDLLETEVDNLNKNTGISEYETFSDAKAYSAGDTVMYNGLLYTFTTDHVSGPWDESQVERFSLNKKIDYLENKNIFLKQAADGYQASCVKELFIEYNGEASKFLCQIFVSDTDARQILIYKDSAVNENIILSYYDTIKDRNFGIIRLNEYNGSGAKGYIFIDFSISRKNSYDVLEVIKKTSFNIIYSPSIDNYIQNGEVFYVKTSGSYNADKLPQPIKAGSVITQISMSNENILDLRKDADGTEYHIKAVEGITLEEDVYYIASKDSDEVSITINGSIYDFANKIGNLCNMISTNKVQNLKYDIIGIQIDGSSSGDYMPYKLDKSLEKGLEIVSVKSDYPIYLRSTEDGSEYTVKVVEGLKLEYDCLYIVSANPTKFTIRTKGAVDDIVGYSNTDNKWKGKNILTIGDSITYGAWGNGTTWPNEVATQLGMNLQNHSKGGIKIRTMVDGDSDGFPALSVDDVKDKDLIILAGFYNNINQAVDSLGEKSDIYPAQDTFTGNLNYAIDKVYKLLKSANNVRCKVVILSAHKYGRNEYMDKSSYETGEAIFEGTKMCADYNSIPLIDAMHKCNINKYNWDFYQSSSTEYNKLYIPSDGINNSTNKPFASLQEAPSASENQGKYITIQDTEGCFYSNGISWEANSSPYIWLGDQLHPNSDGYKRIASLVISFLKCFNLE